MLSVRKNAIKLARHSKVPSVYGFCDAAKGVLSAYDARSLRSHAELYFESMAGAGSVHFGNNFTTHSNRSSSDRLDYAERLRLGVAFKIHLQSTV